MCSRLHFRDFLNACYLPRSGGNTIARGVCRRARGGNSATRPKYNWIGLHMHNCTFMWSWRWIRNRMGCARRQQRFPSEFHIAVPCAPLKCSSPLRLAKAFRALMMAAHTTPGSGPQPGTNPAAHCDRGCLLMHFASLAQAAPAPVVMVDNIDRLQPLRPLSILGEASNGASRRAGAAFPAHRNGQRS